MDYSKVTDQITRGKSLRIPIDILYLRFRRAQGYLVLWRLPAAQGRSVSAPAALWPQCTSSSGSVAAVYQLQQLFHPARNQASTRRVGELRFITTVGSEEIVLRSLSAEEGFHKAFMG